MKRITIGVTAVVVGTWVLGLILSPPAWNGRGVVHELFFVTGTVAYAWMALCMVIALRPAWLERVTKTPLDELYRHHRWLGYGAVILSVLHWITKFWAPIFTQFMDLAPARRPSGSGAGRRDARSRVAGASLARRRVVRSLYGRDGCARRALGLEGLPVRQVA